MHQPAPGKPCVEPNITINGQRLNACSGQVHIPWQHTIVVIDDEGIARLANASAAFGRLHKNVWNRRAITTKTNIKVYRAIVLIILLYGCETWTVYQRHARKLNHFHTTCLRKLLGIKWQDKITDTEVLTRADTIHVADKRPSRDAQRPLGKLLIVMPLPSCYLLISLSLVPT